MSEFAMVEELADLVKDNLHCKHLVLSMEEDFIDFLNNDTSPDGIMELPPMNSYNRLLLHRLADIFGFSHGSIGEGEDRHLILKRCPETTIPSILVSDILGQYDGYNDTTTSGESIDDTAVKKLAYKVKDDLQSKHLVLTMEKVFIEFIKNDTSTDDIMHLQPMSTYNRHLMHLLADIFGFSHESAGEGEDRHLVLERCEETSIPPSSILVSDILLHGKDHQYHPSTASRQLLRRAEDSPELEKKKMRPDFEQTLEEREAAYKCARERIFSKDVDEKKESGAEQKQPRHVPVVAQRMIAHALGQKIKDKPSPPSLSENEATSKLRTYQEETSNSSDVKKNKLKETGAAKRLFDNAMGLSSSKS